MVNQTHLYLRRVLTVAFLSMHSVVLAQQPIAIPLQENTFDHIRFGKIKSNAFKFVNQEMRIDVNDSASFLMLPLDNVKKIQEVQFQWKMHGKLLVENAQHEKQRDGDDAVFKLGLLLKSDETFFNPFIPSWLRQVRSALKFPSFNMIYLVANAKNVAGETWVNPFNDRVTMISTENISDENGWNEAKHKFSLPVEVVGVWLMADGDNTHSQFTTLIKNIEIW